MNAHIVDPVALHLALRRIAHRESARRRRGAQPGWWGRVFNARRRREHIARLGPGETVHNNLRHETD